MSVGGDTEDEHVPRRVLEALLMPLRLPGRVVSDLEAMAGLISLLRKVEGRLASVDDSAGEIAGGVNGLQESLHRIDGRVAKLESLQDTVEHQMEAVRHDLEEQMGSVNQELQAMRPAIQEMNHHLAKIERLLPDPSSGALGRLKDTFTSSD